MTVNAKLLTNILAAEFGNDKYHYSVREISNFYSELFFKMSNLQNKCFEDSSSFPMAFLCDERNQIHAQVGKS